MTLQHQRGFIDEAALRDLSSRESVPLYRLEGLVSFYPYFRRTAPPAAIVHVCRDVVCAMQGCGKLTAELRRRLQDSGNIELHEVSCLGLCETAPALSINDIPVPQETVFNLESLLELAGAPDKLVHDEPPEASPAWKCDPYQQTADRYGTITALVGGKTDVGAACIDALKACNLRGMGGAGFPTGRKWELVSLERPEPKYVICNADESEPGTFKDRVILETLPHLVIEGMLLAGLTIGAEQGIVYIRHEYERQRGALEAEISRAQAAGILGKNAAGSGRHFDIEIFISPGGYILGEETALLEALEDKRGEPRNKPPYPGTHGLWGKPTLINNVETFALATSIVHHGSDWWNEQAAGNHAGLKFVSISGDVAKPGVYEIPVGTTVAELIEQAGGMRNGRPLKAFLPGGASSKFLTAAHAKTPLDFEAMQQVGSMLGTGAVIVIDDGHDLFALATNIVRFFRNESCGKCVPCRIGSEKAVELLEDVQAGKRETSELEVLTELGETLEQTSICGLGQVALNPILSMLKCFPEETP
jgi:NADH:ubiquinone oxidoreductase subunit F (NADH-binding)/NADH:ubiquinone oxidoreductase subunit E